METSHKYPAMWIVVMTLDSHNFCSVYPILIKINFSESLEKSLQNDILNIEIAHFWQFHPSIVHGFLPKMGQNITINFITPFKRTHFKLLKKQKIFEIRSSKLELRRFFKFSLV